MENFPEAAVALCSQPVRELEIADSIFLYIIISVLRVFFVLLFLNLSFFSPSFYSPAAFIQQTVIQQVVIKSPSDS